MTLKFIYGVALRSECFQKPGLLPQIKVNQKRQKGAERANLMLSESWLKLCQSRSPRHRETDSVLFAPTALVVQVIFQQGDFDIRGLPEQPLQVFFVKCRFGHCKGLHYLH